MYVYLCILVIYKHRMMWKIVVVNTCRNYGHEKTSLFVSPIICIIKHIDLMVFCVSLGWLLVLWPTKLTPKIYNIHIRFHVAIIINYWKNLRGVESAVSWWHFVSYKRIKVFISPSVKLRFAIKSCVLCLAVMTQEWCDMQDLSAITIVNYWLLLQYINRMGYNADKMEVFALSSLHDKLQGYVPLSGWKIYDVSWQSNDR